MILSCSISSGFSGRSWGWDSLRGREWRWLPGQKGRCWAGWGCCRRSCMFMGWNRCQRWALLRVGRWTRGSPGGQSLYSSWGTLQRVDRWRRPSSCNIEYEGLFHLGHQPMEQSTGPWPDTRRWELQKSRIQNTGNSRFWCWRHFCKTKVPRVCISWRSCLSGELKGRESWYPTKSSIFLFWSCCSLRNLIVGDGWGWAYCSCWDWSDWTGGCQCSTPDCSRLDWTRSFL